MTTAAHYHPASADEVGGDFYDVFHLPGDRWGFFLGDVCGEGPESAALTSLARYTLRSTATHEHDETVLLRTVNAVPAPGGARRGCCAMHRRLREPACGRGPVGRRARVRGSSTTSSDRRRRNRPLPRPPRRPGAGAFDNPTIAVATVELRSGDTLVLYSDGLTEARIDAGRNRYEEEHLLAFATSLAPASPIAVVASIQSLLTQFGDGVDDDVAVLALGVPPASIDAASAR
ncbi:PP2C family protein-serine/threonine phosphatase [Actinomycetes bacterium KLBMP 9759]